jgi:hypothetical protein
LGVPLEEGQRSVNFRTKLLLDLQFEGLKRIHESAEMEGDTMVNAQQNIEQSAIPLVVPLEPNEGAGHLWRRSNELTELVE